MTLELGKYAAEVLSAYGVSLALILGLCGWSWRRYRRVKAEMDRIERGRDG
jgi:heme exporter protein D